MPVTVEEVTADVAPSERRGEPQAAAEPHPLQPSGMRRQREQLERLQLRAARVAAN
jgi:hypothetical protein